NRDKKKNTDSSAGFHQNQLESICVFYLLASFCPASFWQETKSIYQFLSIAYRSQRLVNRDSAI
ncbi:hypothetical protein, partial [Streptococcus parasuis]|uniref:hypothetical protein n=1 Tax=Streptococcus parasuis TaxID=1501662 RepID=UPI001A9337EE